MAKGGYRPNSGRPLGAKASKTIAREMAAKAEMLRTRAKKTDLEVMLEIRDYFMGAAAQEQRAAQEEGRKPDREVMSTALELAGAMAAKRAPYVHHRLQAITIREEPLDLTRLSDAELASLERIRAKASVDGSDTVGEGATQH